MLIRNNTPKIALYGGIIVIVLSLVAVGLKLYIDSTQPPPGTGPQAELGLAMAEKIIIGLDRHLADVGYYPQNLDSLVPNYLEVNPQRDTVSKIKFTYFPGNTTYSLRFIYETPAGTVECNYAPVEKRWRCGMKY